MAEASLAPGEVFAGCYRIDRVLSEGEDNRVYAATLLDGEMPRALKIFTAPRAGIAIKEAGAIARAGGGLVAEILYESPASEPPWMVMTLVPGEDLRALLAREGRLSSLDMGLLIERVAAALDKLAEGGVIHGDLRPEKVMWDAASERAVLLPPSIGDRRLDQLAWLPPEKIDGRALLTPAIDVWGLGLLGFYLLTGGLYWAGETPAQVVEEIMTGPRVAARARAWDLGARTVPAPFEAWLARCLALDPRARFATVKEAAEALLAVPEPTVVVGNPKGSSYDAGLQDSLSSNDRDREGSDEEKKKGYRDAIIKPPEIERDHGIILANPKGSFYDRGLRGEEGEGPRPIRWFRFVPLFFLLVMIVGTAIVLLRR